LSLVELAFRSGSRPGALIRVLAVLFALSAIAVRVEAQSYHETARVGLIRVDLTVTDSDGRPVPGLRRSEIRLKVDGKPAQIEALDAIDTEVARTSVGPEDTIVGETASSAQTPAPESTQEPPALSLAILIDETSIAPFSKKIIEASLSRFLDQPLPPGVQLLVERFDGGLHVECPWTGDVSKARAAAARVFRRSFLRLLPSPTEIGDLDGPALPDIGYFSKRSLDAVFQALLLFPEVGQGRRGLVWVTDGTPLLSPLSLGFAAAAQAERPPIPGRPQSMPRPRNSGVSHDSGRTEPRPWDENAVGWTLLTEKIEKKAIQKAIAILPVNSQPLDAGLFLGDAGSQRQKTITMGSFAARADVVHAMTAVGSATGGEATLLGGNLDRELRNVVERRRAGYILTFRDPSPKDPRFHDIDLSVLRPNVRLIYRKGFQTLEPLAQLADRVMSNLYLPRPTNPLDATVRTTVLERQKDLLTIRLTVTFPALPEAGGLDTRSRTVQVVAACLDPKGRATLPFGEVGATRTIQQEEKTLLEHSFVIHLRPGRHTWSLGVRDQASGIASYLRFTTTL
jgi:VWFA-related protein